MTARHLRHVAVGHPHAVSQVPQAQAQFPGPLPDVAALPAHHASLAVGALCGRDLRRGLQRRLDPRLDLHAHVAVTARQLRHVSVGHPNPVSQVLHAHAHHAGALPDETALPVDHAALAVDDPLSGDLSQHHRGLLPHLRGPRPAPVRNLRQVARGHAHPGRKLLHREPAPPGSSHELGIGPRIRCGAGSVNARSRHVASSCNEEAGPPPCRRQSRSDPCPDGRDCLLGWRCCRGEWPVRHPPESSPGQAPSWGWGKRDGSPQGERAEEATTPVRGAAWWNGAPVQAGAGRRRPGVQAEH